MSFKDIDLKSSYETGIDDLIDDFYIPVLSKAVKYDRIAGFFSSSSLAISAEGIIGFLENGTSMRIIASPYLNKEDSEIIKLASTDPEKYLNDFLINDLVISEDIFEQQHVNALGWLLAKGILEIKIAFVFDKNGQISHDGLAMFHQKIGILYDDDNNIISFSGSVNESANGWLNNVEEFKVFRSWKEEQRVEYMEPDIKKFEDFWNENREYVKLYSLPEAVKNKMISFSDEFQKEKIIISRYKEEKNIENTINNLSLFDYQLEAIEKWKQNNRKLLFQMATGTGKTRTAIGAILDTLKNEDKLLIIICTPQGTLSLQWKNEIEKLNIDLGKSYIIDGTNTNWKREIEELIIDFKLGFKKSVVLYTTHETYAKDTFINAINKCEDNIKIMFVGDEAHGLGSNIRKNGLIDRYNYRIGLSATPSRWFDEPGTKIIEDYFGNDYFEFSISDALFNINPLTGKPFLIKYFYYLKLVELNEGEIDEYRKLSNKISRLSSMSKNSDEYNETLETLLFKRADIVKNAEGKYSMLRSILKEIGNEIKNTIIFVSPEQIDKVLSILKNEFRIPAHKLTQEEGTRKKEKFNNQTERQDIIKKFKNEQYRVLVAIKVLDEGIDIPSASRAILMSSSSNPREYIQRIGRVIRQAEGKENPEIYDISIKSSLEIINDPELGRFEKKIIKNEKIRLKEISKNAINNVEASKEIEKIGG